MIAYLFFFHMVHLPVFDHSYWVRDGCSAIIFVKHVKTVFVQVHNAVWLHELLFLLLFCESSRNAMMQRKQRTFAQNNFDMFYKIDRCAAIIRGRIWINNVYIPNEIRIIMLVCTEISFVTCFFDLEKFGVKPGFPVFFFNSRCVTNDEFK